MNVNEAIEQLQKLADQGYGYLSLIYVDTRSGNTDGVNVSSSVKEKNENDCMGELCDFEDGRKYVPIYTDH